MVPPRLVSALILGQQDDSLDRTIRIATITIKIVGIIECAVFVLNSPKTLFEIALDDKRVLEN